MKVGVKALDREIIFNLRPYTVSAEDYFIVSEGMVINHTHDIFLPKLNGSLSCRSGPFRNRK